MASSGNFCTLNPLAQLGGSTDASTRAGGMSNGNLKYVNQTGNTAVGSFALTSGKWYFEVRIDSMNADNGMSIGFVNNLFNLDAELGYNSPSSPSGAQGFGWYAATNNLIYGPGDGGGTYNKSWGGGSIVTDEDIVGIYLDVDNLKFWAAKNGTVFNSGDPAAGTGHGFGTGGSPHNIAILPGEGLYPAIGNWSVADATVTFNFGQDDTFGGTVTAAGNADGNGHGVFKYAPPTGFLAICSANLSVSDDIDPAQTDDDYPGKNFNAILYTGTGSSNAISNLGFKPDLVWLKQRNSTNSNKLIDSTRGATYAIESDTTQNSSSAESNGLTAFGTDGFTVGSDSAYNGSSSTYVAWAWKANGGTTASNADGDITSTVQANTKAGFSIVKWTSNNQSNQDIGHGLSAAPKFIISKPYSASTWSWHVFHHYLGSIGNFQLNSGDAFSSGTATYGAMPTSSVFRVGTPGNLMPNNTNTDVISYCWHDVEGFSKFGTYTGSADADGPFVYTGFRPRLLVIKKGSGSNDWSVLDTARTTNNPCSKFVRWESNAAEFENTSKSIDILSNGFKIRNSNDVNNGSGGTYAYMAWGDVPFKYNNTF